MWLHKQPILVKSVTFSLILQRHSHVFGKSIDRITLRICRQMSRRVRLFYNLLIFISRTVGLFSGSLRIDCLFKSFHCWRFISFVWWNANASYCGSSFTWVCSLWSFESIHILPILILLLTLRRGIKESHMRKVGLRQRNPWLLLLYLRLLISLNLTFATLEKHSSRSSLTLWNMFHFWHHIEYFARSTYLLNWIMKSWFTFRSLKNVSFLLMNFSQDFHLFQVFTSWI